MADRATRYAMLVASLPALPPHYAAKYSPISRIQLEKRLLMLDEDDSAQLAQVTALVDWAQQPQDGRDEAIAHGAGKALEALDNPLLHEVVRWRLELRSLVAALRRRQAGRPAPAPRERWCIGRWCDHMVRHWSEPGLRMERVFPLVSEAARLLKAGDHMALERLLLGAEWEQLRLAGVGHYFDFEAVALYVLRWDILERWSHYDSERARARFDELVEQGLENVA